MNILFSPLTLQMGIEVHLTNAKSLRSRVRGNFQARFCRGAWGGDSPFDLSATLSDRTTIEVPATIKQTKIKLAKLQWRNRNKQLGNKRQGIPASNNAKKYYKQVAKIHARISNIRRDFLQKLTTDISQKYHCIRIEDLKLTGM